jgi:hypothetical protein
MSRTFAGTKRVHIPGLAGTRGHGHVWPRIATHLIQSDEVRAPEILPANGHPPLPYLARTVTPSLERRGQRQRYKGSTDGSWASPGRGRQRARAGYGSIRLSELDEVGFGIAEVAAGFVPAVDSLYEEQGASLAPGLVDGLEAVSGFQADLAERVMSPLCSTRADQLSLGRCVFADY